MMPRRSPGKPVRNKRIVKVEKTARSPMFTSVNWGRVRLWGVGIFFSLLWCMLWGRAYQLQIIQGPELAEMARRQQTAKQVLLGMRGNVLDRNGNILARSIDCQSVWINPTQVGDNRVTADTLGKILEMPANKILPMLQDGRKFVWVKRKISDKAASQVKEAALPGVFLAPEFDRLYPYEHLAGQLVGFVDVDDKGLEGIEKAFDTRLSGQRVRQYVQRDAAGRRMTMRGSEDTSDLRGQDIHLTIDTHVQFFAEEALAENVEKYGAKWGGCIVVDVASGEILAWAQYPFFNPNHYRDYAPVLRRNRLAMDALEQGSTIKSFLIAAALEEKVVVPSTVINCEKGKWALRTATIHDTHPYSTLTVDKVLHVSSNIGAAKIGMKLGAAKYYNYLTRLGFGSRPELPLAGEARGILRSAQQWQEIDLAATSFGQSFSATLAQMAQAYLCLAGNGTKRSLTMVSLDGLPELPPEEQSDSAPVPTGEAISEGQHKASVPVQVAISSGVNDRIFSPATMKLVRGMMREVVEEEGGTGAAARIPGIEVGGKTGTAQKADRSGKYGAGRVGSFVGMVPIDDPKYLICVLLDEPTKNQYGGVVAAPVFRYVALRTMAYHGLLPDNDDAAAKAAAEKESGKKGKKGKMPATADDTLAVGGKNSSSPLAGQNATTSAGAQNGKGGKGGKAGKGDKRNGIPVTPETSPASGATTAATPPARRSTPPNTVPSVVGMGVRQAVGEFVKQGVMPSIKGKGGFVGRQMPEPGTAWSDKKESTLWLEERVI